MCTHVLKAVGVPFSAHIGGEDRLFHNYFSGGFDYFVTEACEYKKNFLKFIVKVYENRDSLEWINNENIIKLKQNIEELVNAYDLRYEALSENGIKRFNKILECYKKNAYKRFHGFRTAIDDFLRD